MTIPFVTSGQLGINLSELYVPSSGLYPYVTNNQQFALGQQITALDNSVWVYVLFGVGGVTGLGYSVVIDEAFGAVMMSNSVGGLGDKIGVAPVAAAAGSYGWVQVYGTCDDIRVSASCAANVPLASTATAGELDDATGTGTKNITGIILTTARAASAGNAPGMLNYPVIGTTNA